MRVPPRDRDVRSVGGPRSVPPGSWLGLWGGQLGRMFCMAAQSLGYRVAVLDPGGDSPAGSVADRTLRADYLDARRSPSSRALSARPRPSSRTSRRRARVSSRARARDAARREASRSRRTASARRRSSRARLRASRRSPCCDATMRARVDAALLPGIVKSARFGYDGKGQMRVASREIEARVAAMRGSRACSSARARSPAKSP
jgi:5-(carboxyamino)imidazole ribonucleotide synthase